MGPFNGLTFWLSYFAPSLIAWYRVKNGKPIFGTVGQIVLYNLLIGWTVVGWFLMLANAFGYNPVAWFVLRFGKHLTTSGPAPAGPRGAPPSEGPGLWRAASVAPRAPSCARPVAAAAAGTTPRVAPAAVPNCKPAPRAGALGA